MGNDICQFVGAVYLALTEAVGGDRLLSRANELLCEIADEGAVSPVAVGLIDDLVEASSIDLDDGPEFSDLATHLNAGVRLAA